MGLLFVQPILREIARATIKYGYKFERAGFEKAYRAGGYSRKTGRAVHKGYRIGTVVGSVGAGLRDAFISSLEPTDTQNKKTGTNSYSTGRKSGFRRSDSYTRCRPRTRRSKY